MNETISVHLSALLDHPANLAVLARMPELQLGMAIIGVILLLIFLLNANSDHAGKIAFMGLAVAALFATPLMLHRSAVAETWKAEVAEAESHCDPVLSEIRSGELRYLTESMSQTVIGICGRDPFLVAANSSGSRLVGYLVEGGVR